MQPTSGHVTIEDWDFELKSCKDCLKDVSESIQYGLDKDLLVTLDVDYDWADEEDDNVRILDSQAFVQVNIPLGAEEGLDVIYKFKLDDLIDYFIEGHYNCNKKIIHGGDILIAETLIKSLEQSILKIKSKIKKESKK